MLTGEGGLLASARLVCHCLLIEDSQGLVLVDTGFGNEDTRNGRQLGRVFNTLVRPRLRLAETAHSQIIARGLQPGDVRQIVTTHLDLDHSGGLPDFPDAEVHLLGAERAATINPPLRERQRYIAAHWSHQPRWVEHEGGGEQWFGFDGVRILPGRDAEILLIPLPGHSAGHAGVAIRSGGGRWLLHCGDAYFHRGEVQSPPRGPAGSKAYQGLMAHDLATRRANLERLRELALRHGEDVELICSHDPVTLDEHAARA
jgi:glyoxylase-like metal-dependent hydrolase (beta-lactamase superfamily II)